MYFLRDVIQGRLGAFWVGSITITVRPSQTLCSQILFLKRQVLPLASVVTADRICCRHFLRRPVTACGTHYVGLIFSSIIYTNDTKRKRVLEDEFVALSVKPLDTPYWTWYWESSLKIKYFVGYENTLGGYAIMCRRHFLSFLFFYVYHWEIMFRWNVCKFVSCCTASHAVIL